MKISGLLYVPAVFGSLICRREAERKVCETTDHITIALGPKWGGPVINGLEEPLNEDP